MVYGWINNNNPLQINGWNNDPNQLPTASMQPESKPEEGVAAANSIIIILFAIILFLSTAAGTGLIWWHYSFRTQKWLQISKLMHQRLSRQILKEDNFTQLCGIINVSAETIHLDRKEHCPSFEEGMFLRLF